MRDALADHRSDLAEIRGEVESMRDGLNERLATASKMLEKLSVERADLQRERTMLKASMVDKTRVETELRAQLSSLKKAAEGAREADATTSSAAAAAVEMLNEANAEVARLKSEKAELERAAEVAAARASSAAAMEASSNASGDRAAQMSLKGKEAELAAMREELESQARVHRAQMAELQESCHAKLREMRRVHDTQLAAAKAEKKEASVPPQTQTPAIDAVEIARLREEHAKEVRELNADVAKLRRELEAAAERERAGLENAMRLADKEKKKIVEAADAERRRHESDRAGLESELEDTRRRLAAAEEEAATSAKRLAESTSASQGREAAGNAGGAQLDMEALDLMETQVVKLSNILKERERELAVLQATVEGQCAERHQLIAALQAYHDAAGGGVGPAGGHGGGGGGGGGGGHQQPGSNQSSPSKPKSQAAAALANTNLMSPRKIGRRVRPVSMSKAFK